VINLICCGCNKKRDKMLDECIKYRGVKIRVFFWQKKKRVVNWNKIESNDILSKYGKEITFICLSTGNFNHNMSVNIVFFKYS